MFELNFMSSDVCVSNSMMSGWRDVSQNFSRRRTVIKNYENSANLLINLRNTRTRVVWWHCILRLYQLPPRCRGMNIMKTFQFMIFGICMANVFGDKVEQVCNKTVTSPQHKLKKQLFCDYDPVIRPTVDLKNKTTVVLDFLPKSCYFVSKLLQHSLAVN